MTRDESRATLVDLCREVATERRHRGLSCLWQVKRDGERVSSHLTEGAARRWVEDCNLAGSFTVETLDATVENHELERALEALASFAEEG